MGGVLVFGTIRLSPTGFRNYPTAVLAGAFVALAAPLLFALFLIVPPSAPLMGVAADYLSDTWPYGLWGGCIWHGLELDPSAGCAGNEVERREQQPHRPRIRPAAAAVDKGNGPGPKEKREMTRMRRKE